MLQPQGHGLCWKFFGTWHFKGVRRVGWVGGEGVKGMVFCRDVSATCLLVNVAASKEKRLAIESRPKAENQCYFFKSWAWRVKVEGYEGLVSLF